MGHFIFVILHLFAFFCGFFGLFITIPLHVIYSAMLNNNQGLNPPTANKPSQPVNYGRLIGLGLRVIFLVFGGLILFALLGRLYFNMYGRFFWQ